MSRLPTLFHYTVGPKLDLIARSGVLMPTGYGLALSEREKPVLWWSDAPFWEPTATKILSLDGGRTFVRPSFEEMRSQVGAFRFVLTPCGARSVNLKRWPALARLARIDEREAANMTASGVRMGAVPAGWWGCFEPVPLPLVEVQELQGADWATVAGGLPAACSRWAARGIRVEHSSATREPRARGL